MKAFQNFFLFFFIFLLILLAGCKVEVQQTVSTTPPAPSEQQQAQAQEAQPQTTPPVTNIPTADITSVKCDSQAYNLLVKPKYLIMWIMLQPENKQKILDLKSEGLIEEFNEIIMNAGASSIPTKQTYKGLSAEIISSRGAGEINIPSGWISVVANVKVENADKVRERIQELKQIKVGNSYGGYGMGDIWGNSGDNNLIFEFKCRIPTGPGRIVVYSNIQEASFTATGPKSYNGKGACFQALDAPPGEYTFIFNDVPGYTKPGKFVSSGLKMTLVPESHIMFGATYTPDTEANTGTLVVITNLPEATFTITGPATYSGKGTCWSQTNVALGQYEVNFDDVPGYELSYFDKKKSIYLSSGFRLQTANVEYKKIGEES